MEWWRWSQMLAHPTSPDGLIQFNAFQCTGQSIQGPSGWQGWSTLWHKCRKQLMAIIDSGPRMAHASNVEETITLRTPLNYLQRFCYDFAIFNLFKIVSATSRPADWQNCGKHQFSLSNFGVLICRLTIPNWSFLSYKPQPYTCTKHEWWFHPTVHALVLHRPCM